MGYNINYKYYKEFKDKKGYDDKNEFSLTVKLGKQLDDVSLEVLAMKVMSLLARRDIWVFDLTIEEYVKKNISFKQSKDGIIIKNKKFKFNNSSMFASIILNKDDNYEDEDDNYEDEDDNIKENIKNINQQVKKPTNKLSKNFLKKEIFMPEANIWREENLKTKYKMIVNKEYDIYNEYNIGRFTYYELYDENNKKVTINSIHFVPKTYGLSFSDSDDLPLGMGVSEIMKVDGEEMQTW